MRTWKNITIHGLSRPDGSPYVITIGLPVPEDDYFSCFVKIPGVIERNIYQETELHAILGALGLVAKLTEDPAPGIVRETTLEHDAFPELTIEFEN